LKLLVKMKVGLSLNVRFIVEICIHKKINYTQISYYLMIAIMEMQF